VGVEWHRVRLAAAVRHTVRRQPDADAIRRDVLEGYVSREAARRDYGIDVSGTPA